LLAFGGKHAADRCPAFIASVARVYIHAYATANVAATAIHAPEYRAGFGIVHFGAACAIAAGGFMHQEHF
jgi:hypothetical protein